MNEHLTDPETIESLSEFLGMPWEHFKGICNQKFLDYPPEIDVRAPVQVGKFCIKRIPWQYTPRHITTSDVGKGITKVWEDSIMWEITLHCEEENLK